MADIREWMRRNMLMLNDDKTELILFHPKSTNSVELPQGVTVGNSSISPSKAAKNLRGGQVVATSPHVATEAKSL